MQDSMFSIPVQLALTC